MTQKLAFINLANDLILKSKKHMLPFYLEY
jgi:hypothetical protein